MYLQGTLTIDPAQLTHIERVKPTKGFGKIAYFLTGGAIADQEERETFCAITILQQINKVMRSVGVNNIVKLATDSVVFYEDHVGKMDDLQEALDAFSAKASTEDVTQFNELQLVLEHHLDEMACLIDIRVARKHSIGKHPITITINGLPNELTAENGEEHVRAKLSGIFSSQGSYDGYVDNARLQLTQFLDLIESNFHEHMKIDDVGKQSRAKIIRPKKRTTSRDNYRQSHDDYVDSYDYNDPVYHGYHGFDDFFFYSWIWSDYMHDNNIHCHDCVIVDESGKDVLEVGEEGFVAGEDDTLNTDEPFSVPESDDITVCDDHAYVGDVETTKVAAPEIDTSGSDSGGGWLSGLADSFSDTFSSDGGGCSASSCGSSCGSCGGGCGGD